MLLLSRAVKRDFFGIDLQPLHQGKTSVQTMRTKIARLGF